MNELLQKYPEEIRQILNRYPEGQKRSAVMPLLYLAQRQTGQITPQGMAEVAEIVEISTTDVASIVGFYSLFHEEPGGRFRIQVCTDLPCALRGAESFLEELSQYLGVAVGETTTDGLFTLEEVKCLAACHRAPVFQLQGDGELTYHENQTIAATRAFIDEIRRRALAGETNLNQEEQR